MRRRLGFAVWVALIALQWAATPATGANTTTISESLEDAILEYAANSLKRHRTGTICNITLPDPRFRAVEVSAVRYRSSSFWARGVNFSYIHIPPRTIPTPYSKRLVIIFENLHNLSSQYYRVPAGHKLVAPVIGFSTYDASNTSLVGINLTVTGDPISIKFPWFPEPYPNGTVKCVTFGTNTSSLSVQFSNMTSPNVCLVKNQGHFSLAIPTVSRGNTPVENGGGGGREWFWKWWVVGFVGGFAVLVVLGLLGLGVYRVVARRRIREMERESERSESLDVFYFGRGRLPSACMVRTQPSGVENEYVC